MAEGRGHEAGSSAAASQAEPRSKQLEREGKFLVDQVEDGVVAPGRTKRSAPKVVTEEQLMAIASQPIKRSKKAAKQALNRPSLLRAPSLSQVFFNLYKIL